jgi:hypothetical protein
MTAHLESALVRWSALGALVLFTVSPAQAQSKLQPGLWEHTMLMKSGSGQMEGAMAKMQSQLASMPPEQRKMIESRMAQSGASMGAKPNTVQVCLSKERAERGDTPQGDSRCKQEVLQRSGGTMKFRFTCAGNPPSSGEGEYTITGPNAYSGHSVINTVVDGRPERMEMTQSGKWLSADCGSLKPMP